MAIAEPRFPDVEVQLTGEDGNGFFIAARVKQAMIKAGYKAEAEEFFNKALSSDYNALLMTCEEYVTVL